MPCLRFVFMGFSPLGFRGQGSVVVGIAQGDEAVEGGAVVALAFEFVQELIGEGSLAAGQVVIRKIGAHLG